MAELSVPLIHGIVPILALLIIHFLICVLSRKFMFARYLLTGRPAIVISPKGINYKELKSLNMTLDDLMELVRGCSVFNLSEIASHHSRQNNPENMIKPNGQFPIGDWPFKFLSSTKLLTCYDCTHWACISASTAVDAEVWIDLVDVTLRDCSHWALWQTCTACCTVFCNSVSHFFYYLKLLMSH